MVRKAIKYVVAPTLVVLLVGGLLFGSDVFSYIHSSARTIRTSVKDSIPTEFELQRARDMLELLAEADAGVTHIAQDGLTIHDQRNAALHHMGEIAVIVAKLTARGE